MQITLNITEDSKVELVKDDCALVQGECCFTDFVFNFPATIKGYAIDEYDKFIEFAECKEVGECVKFVDEINGDKYELNEMCTAFKKIMAQIVLVRVVDGNKITWKTVPFVLEFVESVNANGDVVIQSQLLNLTEIRDEWHKNLVDTKADWAAFVKSDCLRMVYSAARVPLANAESDGETIFYLGENTGDFIYGHYYRCTGNGGVYSWKDLTQDPSIADVANGLREINKSRTFQLYVGEDTDEKAEAGANVDGVLYLEDGKDADTSFGEYFKSWITRTDNKGVLKIGDYIFPYKKLLYEGEAWANSGSVDDTDIINFGEELEENTVCEVWWTESESAKFIRKTRVALLSGESSTQTVISRNYHNANATPWIISPYMWLTQSGTLRFSGCAIFQLGAEDTKTTYPITVVKVYKIIE